MCLWKEGNSSASSPEMYISVIQIWDPLDFIEMDDTVHIHDNFPVYSTGLIYVAKCV